jgi:hypothetical protein
MATRKPPTKTAAAPRKRAAATETTSTLTALPTVQAPTLDQVLESKTLLGVLDGAVGQMSWLKASDAAMVELCRRYAIAVDDAVSISEDYAEVSAALWDMAEASESKTLMARLCAIEKAINVGKVTAWVGPLLANTLRDIGGAPGERKGLDGDAPVKSKLQQMRDEAATKSGRTSTAN